MAVIRSAANRDGRRKRIGSGVRRLTAAMPSILTMPYLISGVLPRADPTVTACVSCAPHTTLFGPGRATRLRDHAVNGRGWPTHGAHNRDAETGDKFGLQASRPQRATLMLGRSCDGCSRVRPDDPQGCPRFRRRRPQTRAPRLARSDLLAQTCTLRLARSDQNAAIFAGQAPSGPARAQRSGHCQKSRRKS
jgi:hypothetical protein